MKEVEKWDSQVFPYATSYVKLLQGDRDEFLEGHIPMAVNIPFELIEAGEYTLPKSKYLLVYCAHGVSSMKAALIMSEDGYRVINTVGGLAQYRGPLTRQR